MSVGDGCRGAAAGALAQRNEPAFNANAIYAGGGLPSLRCWRATFSKRDNRIVRWTIGSKPESEPSAPAIWRLWVTPPERSKHSSCFPEEVMFPLNNR